MTTEEIEELKTRHYEGLQNFITQRLGVSMKAPDRVDVLTVAILEAIFLLESHQGPAAMRTLKTALKKP